MRRVIVTTVTSLLMLGLPALAVASPQKVDMCHVNGNGTFRLISIAQAASQSHLDHGDSTPGGAVPGTDGSQFDETCSPELIENIGDIEVLFAVAYTDADADDGGYNPAIDVLIAKFVDGNDNGVPDAGDKVVTNVYPTALTAPFNHLAFSVTEHTIDGASYDSTANKWSLYMDATLSDYFVFQHQAGQERYGENKGFTAGDWTTLLDWIDGPFDLINMSSASRSEPVDFNASENLPGDLQFLDIDILVGS